MGDELAELSEVGAAIAQPAGCLGNGVGDRQKQLDRCMVHCKSAIASRGKEFLHVMACRFDRADLEQACSALEAVRIAEQGPEQLDPASRLGRFQREQVALKRPRTLLRLLGEGCGQPPLQSFVLHRQRP